MHSIHTELDDLTVLLRPSEYVIAVVVPHQVIWREAIEVAVVLQLFLLFCRIFGVLKFHSRFRLYRGLEQIHRIVDGFICGLGFAFHIETALELLSLMRTCQGRYLFNESHTLALRDKLCRLDRIYDHLQLGKLQRTAAYKVLVLSAFIADDVKAAVLEICEIRGNRLSVGMDSAFFEMCKNIR